ncbi:MAG: hypothetical protein ACQEQS_07980 [Thermodesulfobacteriota bacterium]
MRHGLVFICFFTAVLLLSTSGYSQKTRLNEDITVSEFKTIVMQQGKSNVFPLFKIRNNGDKTYTDIKLIYSEPEGLSSMGKKVTISRSNNKWAKLTLKPGQEVRFNPSLKNYTYLYTDTEQAETIYSSEYFFYFGDKEGNNYKTSKKRIDNFVKVVPFNNDISVTGFQTILMEQGKSKVFPVFKIKNRGSKEYNSIKLIYTAPEGLSKNGQRVSISRNDNDWARISLKPGQEVRFNPSFKNYTYLYTGTDQAKTMYSAQYYFCFQDKNGHKYSTPKKRLDNFVKVVPFNNDIAVTSYRTVVMEQGQSKVFPVFKIKNRGSKEYSNIKLIYTTPEGLSKNGQKVTISRNDNDWARISLKPGQEVRFNPSLKNYTYLSADSDQAECIYSSEYHFSFRDKSGHTYNTPRFRLNDFVQVVSPGNIDKIKDYSQKNKDNNTCSYTDLKNRGKNSDFIEIRNMLNTEISKLENIVHPKHITDLKKILKKLDKNLSLNKAVTKQESAKKTKNTDSLKIQIKKDAVGYALDMMNPVKSSKEVSESLNKFKKTTEKFAGD